MHPDFLFLESCALSINSTAASHRMALLIMERIHIFGYPKNSEVGKSQGCYSISGMSMVLEQRYRDCQAEFIYFCFNIPSFH